MKENRSEADAYPLHVDAEPTGCQGVSQFMRDNRENEKCLKKKQIEKNRAYARSGILPEQQQTHASHESINNQEDL